jgi:predicted outer membrane repeat protein
VRSHTPKATARSLTATLAIVGLAVLGVAAFPAAASAATYSVTNTADSGAGSLRDALATADATSGHDTVTFALPSNSVIQLLSTIVVAEGVSLDGSGAPGLEITGQGGLGTFALIVTAPLAADQDFSFSDVIFDGDAASTAGWQGVAIDTSFGPTNKLPRSLVLTRITGRDINSGLLEGPVLRDFAMQAGGPVTITDSTFTNNISSTGTLDGGGAVYIRGTTGLVTVTGSTFTGNTARTGGAIYFEGQGGGPASLSVASSTFTGNTANGAATVPAADGQGGAIAANSISDVTITGSTFSGNTASVDGGALSIGMLQPAGSTVSISTTSFLGNHATSEGGAIWSATTQGDISVSSSTFAGNTLSTDPLDSPLGNSIRLSGTGDHGLSVLSSTFDEAAAGFSTWAIALETTGTSPLTIAHSTVVGPGAVIIRTLSSSASSVTHSILWSLGTADDALVALVYGLPGSNTIATSWSLSSGTAQPYLAVGAGNQFSVANFALGALGDNGGPTRTRLPGANSPAHEGGDPAIVGAPATDQRGLTRVVQTIDIGAVEIQTATLAATGSPVALRLPLTATLMILLGLLALAWARRRLGATRSD